MKTGTNNTKGDRVQPGTTSSSKDKIVQSLSTEQKQKLKFEEGDQIKIEEEIIEDPELDEE